MRKRKNSKKRKISRAVMPEIQRQACASIEENISWYIGGITSFSKENNSPEVGSLISVSWQGRTFLLTAGHVVDGFANSELRFMFRPPGTLDRALWWQSSMPGKLFQAEPIAIIQRFRSRIDDIAALEVSPNLEAGRGVRFYSLDENSKILRPISSSTCAIGVPFDSVEPLNPGASAVSMFALWGNFVQRGKRTFQGFNARNNLLMEFPPAKDGREPGGFSGSGAWYQTPSVTPPIVWAPAPILAGMITDYYRSSKVLLVCRVERLVAFLRSITI